MQVAIQINEEQLRRFDAFLRETPKKAATALQRAVNKAGAKALTVAKRAISKELGIKQADLTRPHRFGSPKKSQSTGKALDLIKAGKDKYEATLRISGRRIPIVYFKPKPADAKRPSKGGVRYRIGSRGNGNVKDAFVGRARSGESRSAAEGTSGHVGVWKRVGKKRLPIIELLGPSIPYAAENNAEFGTALSLDVHPLMVAELDRQLDLIEREWSNG